MQRIIPNVNVVAFKTPSNTTEALTSAFLKLKDECQRDGKPYIKAVKGGKQISSEAFHHDMKVVFIMEFEVSLYLTPHKPLISPDHL